MEEAAILQTNQALFEKKIEIENGDIYAGKVSFQDRDKTQYISMRQFLYRKE